MLSSILFLCSSCHRLRDCRISAEDDVGCDEILIAVKTSLIGALKGVKHHCHLFRKILIGFERRDGVSEDRSSVLDIYYDLVGSCEEWKDHARCVGDHT